LVIEENNMHWRNKKVLITGYEGFLGSHLTRNLLSCGAKISGLDIKTHRKQTILSVKELTKINIIRGNVENFSLISKIIRENKIEYVFHLAAEALVEECFQKPVKAFSTNIKGTWNILEAARNSNAIMAIIIASSDKAYGSHNILPYKENAALRGKHPYDVSKSCADLIAYTYFYTYGLPVVVTRCGNIFGSGDFNFSRIVPNAIKCALFGKKLLIRSDGKFTRDYIYVEDVVDGYISLAQKMQKLKLFGEAFNFSNENPISVLGLVENIYKICGRITYCKILNKAKYEIRNQYLSAKKAKRILGWKPECTLQRGLRETINWYRNFFKK